MKREGGRLQPRISPLHAYLPVWEKYVNGEMNGWMGGEIMCGNEKCVIIRYCESVSPK